MYWKVSVRALNCWFLQTVTFLFLVILRNCSAPCHFYTLRFLGHFCSCNFSKFYFHVTNLTFTKSSFLLVNGKFRSSPTSILPLNIHETKLNVFHFKRGKMLLENATWSWKNIVLEWRSKHERIKRGGGKGKRGDGGGEVQEKKKERKKRRRQMRRKAFRRTFETE